MTRRPHGANASERTPYPRVSAARSSRSCLLHADAACSPRLHFSNSHARTFLLRHCERSEAIHRAATQEAGLLRCARNDDGQGGSVHRGHACSMETRLAHLHFTCQTARPNIFATHCERSEAIHRATTHEAGLLRCARNDGGTERRRPIGSQWPRSIEVHTSAISRRECVRALPTITAQ